MISPQTQARLQDRFAVALAAAVTAGDILARRFGRLTDVAKKGAVDLVTQADREAEASVVGAISAAFGDDRVVAEEGGGRDGSGGTPWTWYVDPLDGTSNFFHGLSHFAVSVGIHLDGVGVAGIVHAPLLGLTFSASKGAGASLNGQPMAVSRVAQLSEALVATGFPYDRQATVDELMPPFHRAVKATRGVRRMGSAALDLAYVAKGTFGGFWEPRLSPWDLAAGAVLVSEAGGRVTDFEGGDDYLSRGSVVATNGTLHAELMRAVVHGG